MTLTVTVPASSANLGAGFDVLGLALSMRLSVSLDPASSRIATGGHPARRAFEAVGGVGEIYCDDHIPSGRGLGFSGAARVGAVALGLAQRSGVSAVGLDEFISVHRAEIHRLAAELEGHGDNVGASTYGGLIVAYDDRALALPVVADVRVLVWIPTHTTSTDSSRGSLPGEVSVKDAVVNIASSTRVVGALVSGDVEALVDAIDDRIHQGVRLAASPSSARMVRLMVERGAVCSWLSGSGPTVAAFVRSTEAESVRAAVQTGDVGDGRLVLLDIDPLGVTAA